MSGSFDSVGGFSPGQSANDKEGDGKQAGDEGEIEAEDACFGQWGDGFKGIEQNTAQQGTCILCCNQQHNFS